jgi:replication-associated recombination protein RarA
MKSAFTEVKTLSNDDLRLLLIELDTIGKNIAPAFVKQSNLMERLFKLEKTKYNYFMDQFHNVDSALRFEVVRRYKNNIL